MLFITLMDFALFAIASAVTPMDMSPISAARAKPLQTPFTEPPSNAVAEGESDEVLRANNWTVGIIGGLREGTGMRFISDIAAVVDDGDDMRVIPITSRGMKRNILDKFGVYISYIRIAFCAMENDAKEPRHSSSSQESSSNHHW